MLLVGTAYAMGGGQGGSPQGSLGAFIPIILIFAVFYFLLILPQQKKAKKHKEFLNNLKKDDMVITSGGLHGKITGVADNIVTLQIASKIRIKVSRSQISGTSEIKDI